MSRDALLENLEMAIENNWKLRPVKGNIFHNIDYVKGLAIDDADHILESLEDLKKFPPGATAFALISKLHDGFISIDLDFKEAELKSQVWALLSQYNKEDLFLRTGNKDKIGQIWFKTYDDINFCSYTGIDIITTQKRCDAIGYYKGDAEIQYEWPYKNIWENEFDDLPIINKELVQEIVECVNKFHGTETNKTAKNAGSRHDQIVQMASDGINANHRMRDIISGIIESDAFKSMNKERNAMDETGNALAWAIKNATKSYIDIRTSEETEKNAFGYDVPTRPPEVDPNSFFDMIYKAIRRNQRIENKRMAMVSTLSICSWILSLSVRFEDVCPNLMILLIAPSGSGKSTSTKAIKELIKLNKKLQLSYFGQDIRTDSAIFTSIQESPIGFYNIDEASKLFKTMSNGGANQNLPEILSQLYSDYKDTDPPNALAKLKNEAYGVSIGAKINMLAYSTPSFWETFDEGNYTQGLGRRLFIVTSSTLPVEKTNYVYSPEFFTEGESKLISMFMDTYIGTDELFKDVDIRGFNIIENVSTKEGVKTTKHFQTCKRPNVRFNLTASEETKEYLQDKFVEESNEFRVKAASSGSPIQEYVANSRAEFIKKFAVIHAVCGKQMAMKKVKKEDPVAMNINTLLGMDSIEWGKQMFDYYMIGSTLENIDSIFGKDKVTDKNNQIIEELLGKLEEKDIKEFKKSDAFIKDFFKRVGGAEYRNTILKEMSAKEIIRIEGDLDHRGCRIKVL